LYVVVGIVAILIGFAIGVMRTRLVMRDLEPPRPSPAPRDGESTPMVEVVEGSRIGVIVSDRDGDVLYRNPAARALSGTHAGVLVDEAIERHLRRAGRGAKTEEVIELYGPPKSVVFVTAAPTANGGAFAFVEDISERRRIDAVRTDFVANISHELKTPVGALAVLAETLADEDDPATIRRIADRMLEEAHRAARTIDDLMELSRIELGGGQQVRGGVDTGDIIRAALERVAEIASRRKITIDWIDPDQSVTVTGDQRQLVSAVGNLVENAVKYSEIGGLVQIRTRVVGPWIEFMIIDQGPGIPSRDLDRIFERFYRVDKARGRDTGGTGLGLSIVRHVATNHGGDVQVSSREGEGSTFVLRIPTNAAGEHPSSRTSTGAGTSSTKADPTRADRGVS
jgi:two-component system, OmpR family, sensor histidine kinase SenX3